MTTPKTGYTREGFLQLLHERLAAAHLAGLYREGFPASSLKLLGHYFDQIAAAPAARSAEGVGDANGNTPYDEGPFSIDHERSAFEAAMREKHPEWAFTPDSVFAYHNERTRCAWEGWQAARAAPTAPAGGEAPVADVPVTPSFDVEAMLRECVPAGSFFGSLKVANAIRAYFSRVSDADTHPSADLRGAAEQALDAARYRWLRDNKATGLLAHMREYIRAPWVDAEPTLDAAVDAAIASLEAAISRKGKTE